MKSVNKEIPIFFSVNNTYAPYLAVALNSMKKHLCDDLTYNVRILHSGLDENNIQKLHRIKENNLYIECANIEEHVREVSTASINHLTAEALYRILIPELFPQYDKVLYLDCDIVILEDISKLYEIELGESLLGCVRNICDWRLQCYINRYIDIPYQEYFNSGILLINARKFREEKIADICLELYANNKSKYKLVDQDVLNVICNGRVKYIQENWNFEWHYQMCGMLPEYEEEYKKAQNMPYIIHYTSDKKPWKYPNFKMAEYFWEYARQSEYYEEILFSNISKVASAESESIDTCFKNYLFPFNSVPKKSSIVLYAAGAVGKAFYQQMSLTKYCNVVLWVDKRYEQLQASGMPVDNPKRIQAVPFDYLVIAVEAERQANEIRDELISLNVSTEKIIWEIYNE